MRSADRPWSRHSAHGARLRPCRVGSSTRPITSRWIGIVRDVSGANPADLPPKRRGLSRPAPERSAQLAPAVAEEGEGDGGGEEDGAAGGPATDEPPSLADRPPAGGVGPDAPGDADDH